MVTPIGIPDDWDDNNLILFEEFCELIRTPQRTVRDWRRRGVGPAMDPLPRCRPALHHRRRGPPLPRLGHRHAGGGAFRWLSDAPSRST